jgi:two-component system CheB/CheR fusion protein
VIKRKLEKKQDRQLLPLITKLDDQVSRLHGLISDLLDTQRLQEGKIFLYKKPFSLTKLCKEVIESCSELSDKHKIILLKTTKVEIIADREKIGQVISNLITNAVKYSPSGGKIYVKIWKEKLSICLSVQDFGIGIPPHMQDIIFNRFSRIDNSKYHVGGLGLGLYISMGIIKLHGGVLWLESEEGKGSTFYFSLPVSTEKRKG